MISQKTTNHLFNLVDKAFENINDNLSLAALINAPLSDYDQPEYYVKSDTNKFTLNILIPGFSKEDLTVSIENKTDYNLLKVSGKSKLDFIKEVDYKYKINNNLDYSNIESKLESGILTLTFNKVIKNKSEIKVEIK